MTDLDKRLRELGKVNVQPPAGLAEKTKRRIKDMRKSPRRQYGIVKQIGAVAAICVLMLAGLLGTWAGLNWLSGGIQDEVVLDFSGPVDANVDLLEHQEIKEVFEALPGVELLLPRWLPQGYGLKNVTLTLPPQEWNQHYTLELIFDGPQGEVFFAQTNALNKATGKLPRYLNSPLEVGNFQGLYGEDSVRTILVDFDGVYVRLDSEIKTDWLMTMVKSIGDEAEAFIYEAETQPIPKALTGFIQARTDFTLFLPQVLPADTRFEYIQLSVDYLERNKFPRYRVDLLAKGSQDRVYMITQMLAKPTTPGSWQAVGGRETGDIEFFYGIHGLDMLKEHPHYQMPVSYQQEIISLNGLRSQYHVTTDANGIELNHFLFLLESTGVYIGYNNIDQHDAIPAMRSMMPMGAVINTLLNSFWRKWAELTLTVGFFAAVIINILLAISWFGWQANTQGRSRFLICLGVAIIWPAVLIPSAKSILNLVLVGEPLDLIFGPLWTVVWLLSVVTFRIFQVSIYRAWDSVEETIIGHISPMLLGYFFSIMSSLMFYYATFKPGVIGNWLLLIIFITAVVIQGIAIMAGFLTQIMLTRFNADCDLRFYAVLALTMLFQPSFVTFFLLSFLIVPVAVFHGVGIYNRAYEPPAAISITLLVTLLPGIWITLVISYFISGF